MKAIKNTSILGLCLVLMVSFSSCDSVKNANNTQKGAALGAVGGAVLGGILGNNLGNGENSEIGAVLGGVVGGTVGGVIGHKMDKQAREIENVLPGADIERVGEGIKLVLGENSVNFEYNKSSLTTLAKSNLDKLVPVFNEYPDTNINIYGHTDSKGSEEYNQKLSEQRATSVMTYLVSKGLVQSRFIVVGKGEIDPIADNETTDGRSKNRRVEFAIIANDKMIEDAQKEVGN